MRKLFIKFFNFIKAWKDKTKLEYSNLYPLFFTLIFILILIQYSFNSLDAIFYDLFIRNDVGISKENKIVIVVMDEETDQFLGEIYPYSYATHLKFINKLINDQPAAISYLSHLIEPESEIETKLMFSFKDSLSQYKDKNGFFYFGTSADVWGEQLPPEPLKSLGHALALINVDNVFFARDDVSRRMILNISGEDSLHLILANYFRTKNHQDQLIAKDYFGAYYNKDADATFALYRFSNTTNELRTNFSIIPFHRVLVGNFPNDYFKDKIVLVGPKYFSNSDDFVKTPYSRNDEKAPKLLLHANIIDSLIKDKTIFEIPNIFSDALAILIAIILSFTISRIQPTKGLLFTVFIMLGVIFLSYGLFSTLGMWLKLSHIILSIFVVYYIWVPFRAIAEYQTRYAIQEESKLLKQVDDLKQNFISLMSHDLKTPVAKIAGIADILKNQFPNTKEQQGFITAIISSTKELNNFITSILDLTKIESRNLNIRKEPKDLNQIIELALDKYHFELEQKDMTVEKNLSPIYPINMDINLINRVISNIVENAIKYSGEHSSLVIETYDDNEWVYVTIADNGAGIAPENLQHIFEKFYRVKNDLSHSVKGSGLGLYLVKYFIELHQGTIEAQSEVTKGTKFIIKLPNK